MLQGFVWSHETKSQLVWITRSPDQVFGVDLTRTSTVAVSVSVDSETWRREYVDDTGQHH